MINIIPHENRTMVVYKGELKWPDSGEPGDPAYEIDGQRVPFDELDAWYTERMMFDWRGQPFHIQRCSDGRVRGGYAGDDYDWPPRQGLDGSVYDGWLCDVPESEIENLRVEKTDLLETWRYRKTFGVEPPEGLFAQVRPATDHEWIRE